MILDNSIKLEAVLDGFTSANPEFHVDYTVWNTEGKETRPEPARGALNSSTDVTLLAAATAQGSSQNERRDVKWVAIFNKDTATRTLTVKTDDGTTERIIYKISLATTETLILDRDMRPTVLQANGAVKQGSGVTGPTSSTDNAAARFDGTTGGIIQNSAFVIDDSGHVTSFGGNIKFPASASASADANTFDDYEEGTWTPAVGGNATYTAQVGRYIKKAKDVTLGMALIINAIGTGSTTTVSGVPFASVNSGVAVFTLAVNYFESLALNTIFLAGVVANNGSTITFNHIAASGATMSASGAVFGSSTNITCSGVYEAAS